MSCSVISRAPSSAASKLPGRARCAAIGSYRTAKFRLKLLATGSPANDLTSAASDPNASLRDWYALAASMATWPARPGELFAADGPRPPGPVNPDGVPGPAPWARGELA